jgi:hypothetical protein
VSRLLAAWQRFWFTPGSALNLAAARIVICAYSLWIVLSRDLAGMAAVPAPFWSEVPAAARLRYLIFPGWPAVESALQWTLVLALALGLLGIFARASCALAAVLLYHLAPLQVILWTPSPYGRGLTISAIALFVLALAPSADALALQPARARNEPWEYGWPLKVIQMFLVQIYFFSFLSKIYVDGFGWGDAETMRNYILLFNQLDHVAVFGTLGPWIAERAWLCRALGLLTLGLEGGFPAVLFSRLARRVLIPLALLFHIAVLFAMNIFFFNGLQLLVFVDWERVRRGIRAVGGRRAAAAAGAGS